MKIQIPKPESLRTPLNVPKIRMLGPGPCDVPPRVLHALSLPVISPIHDECYQLLDEIREGIKYAFQTTYQLTLAISTSGNGAMEAAMANLTEPGETVVIAINGMWSLRAADIAERYGTNVVKVEQELGDVFSLDDIEQALIKHKPVLIYLVLGESSTGTLQPMEGMGDLCHRYNCLLVLDCVPALGVVPIYTDAWGVDVAIGSTQKGLSCPPGLAPIAFSPSAVKKMKSRKSYGPVRYFDALVLGDYWGCFENSTKFYHHTLPLNLYYGMREGLAMLAEEGLEQVWERHRKCQKLLVDGFKKLGIECFVKDEKLRFPGVTTITLPGIDMEMLHDYALKKHATELSLGAGPTYGLVMRIGLLGQNAQPHTVEHILKVMKDGLEYVKNNQNKCPLK